MHSCFDLTVNFSVNNYSASIKILNESNASHKYQGFGKPGKGHHQDVGGPESVIFKKGIWCFWCKEKGHKKFDSG